MTYSPILILHICTGIIGVFSGFMALFVRKGSRLHKRSGDVFVISMMIMGASGALAAFLKSQRFNVFAGAFTFYLVATAFLTVRTSTRATRRVQTTLTLIALALGATAFVFAWQAAHAGKVVKPGSWVGYVIFGLIASSSAGGDVRMLIRGGYSGVQRLTRHIWRMGFGLFIAGGSFFLGTAGDPVMRKSGLRATLFPKEIRAMHLPDVPVIIIVVLTIFWLFRIRFSKTYKKAEVSSGPDVATGKTLRVRSHEAI